MQAYCVKCRTKREMKDARSITMKNGRPATQGTCPVCGTKMFRIGKSQLCSDIADRMKIEKGWKSPYRGCPALLFYSPKATK